MPLLRNAVVLVAGAAAVFAAVLVRQLPAPPAARDDRVRVVDAGGSPLARAGPPVRHEARSPAALPFRDLAQRLRAEPRDAGWAPAGEALIGERLADVPALAGEGALRVTCAATLCEASGWAPSDLPPSGRGTYWEMVQGPALRGFLAARGLTVEEASFTAAGRVTLFFRRVS